MIKKKLFLVIILIATMVIVNNLTLVTFAEEKNNENTASVNEIKTSENTVTNSEQNVNVNNNIDEKIENIVEQENVVIDKKEESIEDNEIEIENTKRVKSVDEEIPTESKKSIQTTEKENKSPSIRYKSHVQNIGWQNEKKDGETAGTTGQSLRIEAIKINIDGFDDSVSIKYQAHIQNIGWQSWKSNGELAGTEGQALRMEAIKIKLESSDEYSVMYRAHVENIGWQDWRYDGEVAGTEGMNYRIEALDIKIVPKTQRGKVSIESPQDGKNIYNKNSIDVIGWKFSNVENTKINAYFDGTKIDANQIRYVGRNELYSSVFGYGTPANNPTPGYKFSIDLTNTNKGKHTIKVEIITPNGDILDECTAIFDLYKDFGISYSSHIQNIGWQGYKKTGELSGTEGRSLRLEALKIKLNNAPTNARIRYKTHIQNIGWQDWKYDNNLSGTEGQSLRIEAIQIALDNLDDFTVEYQVHIQDIGWSQWYIDGEVAGTVGQSKRIEAIRIRLVPKYKRNYTGIDVSVFNGTINWNAVKNSGIEFAMIRVGFRGYGAAGTLVEDSRFKENIENAKKAGVKVGVYFVTQATNESEAVEEANWVINKIRQYQIDYPVAMDVEFSSESNHNGRADNLSKSTRTAVVKRFCQRIKEAGYTPMVYLNVDWAYNYVDMSQLKSFDTWIAHYRNNPNLGPSYTGNYTIWQYTSTGNVSGVSGNVDCNKCYKGY